MVKHFQGLKRAWLSDVVFGMEFNKSCSPGAPLVLSCSLSEPLNAGLHAAHGVSSIQEVSHLSMLQGLGPAGPLSICQP